MPSSILPGTIQPAVRGQQGFDTDTVLTDASAAAFKDAGFPFCARYLSLSNGQNPYDLTTSEAQTILDAGLALTAIQHAYSEGWTPDEAMGTLTGNNAASNAASVGLPVGMNIWCRLENIAPGTPAFAVIDYCQAWYAAVTAAGYVPGLYVGANSILTGSQLSSLPFQHYWRGGDAISDVDSGYQVLQSISSSYTLNQVSYNLDTVITDINNNTALLLVP